MVSASACWPVVAPRADDGIPRAQNRVVLTHDVSTLIGRAFERIKAGRSMPGIIAVAQSMAIGAAIDDLALVIECSTPDEWRNQVRYLPLR
jgi:hypothetical protein